MLACGMEPCPPRPTTVMVRSMIARQQRPGAGRPLPRFLRRQQVERVGGIRPSPRDGQQPLVDHRLRPARALLARLEHEDHVAVEFIRSLAEQHGRADEAGGVHIVPARVHVLVARRELEPGLLPDRQRIHVATEQHRRARCPGVLAVPRSTATTDVRPDPCVNLQRQPLQGAEHRRLGPRQVVAQLGVPVDVPPERDQLGVNGRRRGTKVQVVRPARVLLSRHTATVSAGVHQGEGRVGRYLPSPTAECRQSEAAGVNGA